MSWVAQPGIVIEPAVWYQTGGTDQDIVAPSIAQRQSRSLPMLGKGKLNLPGRDTWISVFSTGVLTLHSTDRVTREYIITEHQLPGVLGPLESANVFHVGPGSFLVASVTGGRSSSGIASTVMIHHILVRSTGSSDDAPSMNIILHTRIPTAQLLGADSSESLRQVQLLFYTTETIDKPSKTESLTLQSGIKIKSVLPLAKKSLAVGDVRLLVVAMREKAGSASMILSNQEFATRDKENHGPSLVLHSAQQGWIRTQLQEKNRFVIEENVTEISSVEASMPQDSLIIASVDGTIRRIKLSTLEVRDTITELKFEGDEMEIQDEETEPAPKRAKVSSVGFRAVNSPLGLVICLLGTDSIQLVALPIVSHAELDVPQYYTSLINYCIMAQADAWEVAACLGILYNGAGGSVSGSHTSIAKVTGVEKAGDFKTIQEKMLATFDVLPGRQEKPSALNNYQSLTKFLGTSLQISTAVRYERSSYETTYAEVTLVEHLTTFRSSVQETNMSNAVGGDTEDLVATAVEKAIKEKIDDLSKVMGEDLKKLAKSLGQNQCRSLYSLAVWSIHILGWFLRNVSEFSRNFSGDVQLLHNASFPCASWLTRIGMLQDLLEAVVYYAIITHGCNSKDKGKLESLQTLMDSSFKILSSLLVRCKSAQEGNLKPAKLLSEVGELIREVDPEDAFQKNSLLLPPSQVCLCVPRSGLLYAVAMNGCDPLADDPADDVSDGRGYQGDPHRSLHMVVDAAEDGVPQIFKLPMVSTISSTSMVLDSMVESKVESIRDVIRQIYLSPDTPLKKCTR
eukprot:Clim_evm45s215 gene=Clim_evmTU45s215